MEAGEHLRVLRRRWWIVVLALTVGASAAVAYDVVQHPRYEARTRLLVAGGVGGGGGGAAAEEGASRQLAGVRATAYAQLVGTAPALEIAAQEAGVLGLHPAARAEAEPKTPFITVTVQADTPDGAVALASAYRLALPRIVRELEQAPTSAIPAITVIEQPERPDRPSTPKPLRDLPLAAVLGLVLGTAAAFLRERFDARLRDTSGLERLAEAPLLGAVPKEHARTLLPAVELPRSGRAEAYRHIRTNLEFSGPGGMPRSLAVTSASPGEGKSGLAANLAVTAAQAGRRVIVVDADLRKPSMARCFGVPSGPGTGGPVGLVEVLAGECTLDVAVRPVDGSGVFLLPSGRLPSLPSELVGSVAMVQLIEELERRFDLVVIDTPPVLPVPDALAIAVHVDGVIIVARMATTRQAALKRAVAAVRRVGAEVLGVVGNAVVHHEERAYGSAAPYGYGVAPVAPAPAPERLAPAVRRRDLRPEAGRRGRRVALEPAPERAAGPAGDVGAEPVVAGGAATGRAQVRPAVRSLPPTAASTASTPEKKSESTAELPIVPAFMELPLHIDLDALPREP